MNIPVQYKQPLRWIIHAICLYPVVGLVIAFLTDQLTANPIQAAMQRTGLAAISILVLMLAFTPLAAITHETYWRSFRKPVGLYAFFYACLHLLIFTVLDFNLNLKLIALQISQKPFIILGMTAFVLLLALAVTTFRSLKKLMGKNWKRLHRSVYGIAMLAVIHFTLAQKANPLTVQGNLLLPLVLGALIVVLLLLRIPVVKKVLRIT